MLRSVALDRERKRGTPAAPPLPGCEVARRAWRKQRERFFVQGNHAQLARIGGRAILWGLRESPLTRLRFRPGHRTRATDDDHHRRSFCRASRLRSL